MGAHCYPSPCCNRAWKFPKKIFTDVNWAKVFTVVIWFCKTHHEHWNERIYIFLILCSFIVSSSQKFEKKCIKKPSCHSRTKEGSVILAICKFVKLRRSRVFGMRRAEFETFASSPYGKFPPTNNKRKQSHKDWVGVWSWRNNKLVFAQNICMSGNRLILSTGQGK